MFTQWLNVALVIYLTVGIGGCFENAFTNTCTSDDDCFTDYRCAQPVTGNAQTADEKICLAGCNTDSECLGSQYCDISVADGGVCRLSEGTTSDDATDTSTQTLP
jgi:hypothetical protein